MANIRELNRKIGSLRNMQKVMRAMNMIASTKFRKMSQLQFSLPFFSDNIERLERDIRSSFSQNSTLEIDGYDKVGSVEIVVFSADKGLCGAHNSTIRKASSLLAETKRSEGVEVEFTCVGTKAAAFCRRNGYKVYHTAEINEKTLTDETLRKMADGLLARFYEGKVHEIHIIFNEFASTLSQPTRVLRALPFEHSDTPPGGEVHAEPESDVFLKESAKAILNYRLKTALLHSRLSENAARMTAMDNATQNSEDLIFRYSKLRNKARQTTITNELIEIVAGKEAMG